MVMMRSHTGLLIKTEFCTASGGLEADESVSVEQRNLNRSFAVDGIGGSPENGRFSM